MIVVDTSVIVSAANAADRHHEAAKKWFDDNQSEELLIPRFCLLEITSALARRKIARAKIEDVLAFVKDRFSISDIDDSFVRENLEVVTKCLLKTGDAIFVTTAFIEKARYLATLDEEQAERAKVVIKTVVVR